MKIIKDLKLAKELIKFPSITPIDSGVMKFLEKKLKKLGFKTKIVEFKEKNSQPVKNHLPMQKNGKMLRTNSINILVKNQEHKWPQKKIQNLKLVK